MKEYHQRIALVNEDCTEIVCYAHERHKVGECPWCDFCRVENITDEFLYRLDQSQIEVKNLYMWSLGTSLKDTQMNRKLLMKRWNLFTKRMYHIEGWVPVFRIIEKGRRGFLHIHVITIKFCDHGVVLRAWRDLTKEKSNVHVSGQKGAQNPRRLTRYLMKYLTKETSAYRWLGPFYGKSRRRSERVSKKRANVRYGGQCYGEFVTEGYEVPEVVHIDEKY